MALGAATLLSACATGGVSPESQPPVSTAPARSAAELIDATTGKVDPKRLDSSVSLAVLVAEQRKDGLDPNDRRFIDAALDQTLRDAPQGPARSWANPANGHNGEVDLQVWLVDNRKNQACGIVNHVSRLGETGPLKGSVTLCRGVANGTWRVDTASFEATPPPVAAVPKAGASKARTAQAKRTSPVAPATTIIIVEQPVAVVRTAPADSGNGVRPMPVITEPTGRFPTAGTGMETLGDALEDRSPHVPAN